MARIKKRNGIWYAWVPDPHRGGVRRVSTRCTDHRAALAEAARLERAAVDPAGHAATRATFEGVLRRFLGDVESRVKAGELSRETLAFYRAKAGVVVAGLASVLERAPDAPVFLSEITAAVVDDYMTLRRELGVTRSTIAHEITTWRATMRLAIRRGLWRGTLDIFPAGATGRNEPRSRWVTFGELLALHAACVRPTPLRQRTPWPPVAEDLFARMVARGDDRFAISAALRELGVEGASPASVERRRRERREGHTPSVGALVGHATFARAAFMIATSAETSAVARARRADVAPGLDYVRVRGSKNAQRDRVVPLGLLPFRLLLAYALEHADGSDGLLFAGAGGFRHRLREACERAGIAPLCPTDLRRTHAKWLRLAGVAPSNIAPSMGHRDSRMVERVYGRASAAELAEVQAAEILAGSGGTERYVFGVGATLGPLEAAPDRSTTQKTAVNAVPRDGIEPPTRGFSIPADNASSSGKSTQNEEGCSANARSPAAENPEKFEGTSEDPLAVALAEATKAGRWALAETIAATLRARSEDPSKVVRLDPKKGRRS